MYGIILQESEKQPRKPCNMMTRDTRGETTQANLFKPLLRDIVSQKHPLVLLADSIDWKSFEDALESRFCADNGRPSCPVRLMVGLQYLKYTAGLSDEGVLAEWCENPYWQYFTGGTFFEHEFPADQASMSRWRRKLSEDGAEKLLEESLKAGLRQGFIKKSEFKRVNVDTTVAEKNIRFPTDARLYDRMRERLVAEASECGIPLRQTYARVGKQLLRRQSGYAKARQLKRAAKQTRKLHTILGRTIRNIESHEVRLSERMHELLETAHRIMEQTRTSGGKVYSIHEPQVECIAKGKAHKRYEFGTKVGLVTSSKTNWILGAKAFRGNPYDGHTLEDALAQSTRLGGVEPEMAMCDLGYRGSGYEGPCGIQVVNRFRKQRSKSLCRWWKRRSAIEPVIGHVKSEHRMNRNYLGGEIGDRLNCIFAAAGFNMRKLLRAFALFLRPVSGRPLCGLLACIRFCAARLAQYMAAATAQSEVGWNHFAQNAAFAWSTR